MDEKGEPVVPPPFADTTTAYSISTAVCAALFHRAKTGEGLDALREVLRGKVSLSLNYSNAVLPGIPRSPRLGAVDGFVGLPRTNADWPSTSGTTLYANTALQGSGALRFWDTGSAAARDCYLVAQIYASSEATQFSTVHT